MDEQRLIHQIEVIQNKKIIVPYLMSRNDINNIKVDVIDISGYVLASEAWRKYCIERCSDTPVGKWRIALLKPTSKGAVIRAKESTVWRGDVDMLNRNIEERSQRIRKLAEVIGADLEIRFYESIPVTRYMKVDQVVFESYYPHDCTGANTSVLILPVGSVVRKRVEKEFEVLWNLLGD